MEKATRLRRGSLYNAFGDKQGLFVAALKRYATTVGRERIEQLSNPDPYRAIEGFLDTLMRQMSDPRRPRGCLHTNTSLEFPNAPDAVHRIIAERTGAIESAIYATLQRAKAQGVLDPAADTRALARFYLGVAKGIGVLHKVDGDALGAARHRQDCAERLAGGKGPRPGTYASTGMIACFIDRSKIRLSIQLAT